MWQPKDKGADRGPEDTRYKINREENGFSGRGRLDVTVYYSYKRPVYINVVYLSPMDQRKKTVSVFN